MIPNLYKYTLYPILKEHTIWDLTSDSVSSIINSWSVSVRQMWNLPRETHRIFIEPLGGTHAKTMLFTRFHKFVQSIMKGKKAAPIYLLETIKKNTQTITGRNIRLILNETEKRKIEDVTIEDLKDKIKLKEIPENEIWKVNFIKELTDVKQNILFISSSEDNKEDFFTKTEIESILADLATS